MNPKKNSHKSRLPLAITLVVASFVSAFVIATISNKGQDFWVLTRPINSGHMVASSDVKLIRMNLGKSNFLYMKKLDDPIGMVATRSISAEELLAISDVTSTPNALTISSVPLSVRAVDLAHGLIVGESVDIYWVLDSRNGEPIVDPILILGGVILLSYDHNGNNFGADVGLTIAVEETQVLRVLSSTTQGRLVVVRSHV